MVHRALELGENYIDRAPCYGTAQEVLGEALDGRKEPYLLGSKCGRWDYKTGPCRDLNAFKEQFEQTLSDLRRDSVDILYIHECDWYPFWEDVETPREDPNIDLKTEYDYLSAPVVAFLMWVKEQGLTRFLGLSGNNAERVAKVLREINLEIDVVLIAFQYDLLWRNAPEHLPSMAKETGVGVVRGAPFHQGYLAAPREESLADLPH